MYTKVYGLLDFISVLRDKIYCVNVCARYTFDHARARRAQSVLRQKWKGKIKNDASLEINNINFQGSIILKEGAQSNQNKTQSKSLIFFPDP